ncbi:MAG: ATP-binding protein [Holdemanella sp.]|nr:ATP-binding protein [Holdemanella sp.]
MIGKKILSVQEKYYIADQGIRNAVYGNNERDIDQSLENIVYMELLRKGYTITIGNKEIDFIATRRNEKIYVQVTYLFASREVVDREFNAYNRIHDNYPKYVISMDDIDRSQNGIIHLNICDFLLNL